MEDKLTAEQVREWAAEEGVTDLDDEDVDILIDLVYEMGQEAEDEGEEGETEEDE